MVHRGTRDASLTISQFGRRAGLSQKALRLYDMSGLLSPAEVDPATGYRLYTVDQLERARLISLLRQLEMPLATIAEVLGGTDEQAAHLVARWWDGQEASHRAKLGTLRHLQAQLNREPAEVVAQHPVRLRDVGETKLATIRREVDQQGLVDAINGGQAEIREHLGRRGARFGHEGWVIYHGTVTPDSEAPIEVCVPFTGTVDPAGPIAIRIEPAHAEAYSTITRDDCYYPRIMLAYDAVHAWTLRTGTPTTGSPREVYIADWTEVAGDEPFAHIAQPIERKP